jgi:hypothetical protein
MVALRTGFSSHSHFTSAFRKEFGRVSLGGAGAAGVAVPDARGGMTEQIRTILIAVGAGVR